MHDRQPTCLGLGSFPLCNRWCFDTIPAQLPMSAFLFDRHSQTCPICHHAVPTNRGKKIKGLYVCPHCQVRSIVCWSGHYVRDPAPLETLSERRSLRSRSLKGDRGRTGKTWLVYPIAIAIGAIALGILSVSLEEMPLPEIPFIETIESDTE